MDTYFQGCKFSDFSLISDFFFTLKHLKITLEISSLERVSRDFMIDSVFQETS